jgi:hypothetical protein
VGDQASLVLSALRNVDSQAGPAVWRGPAAESFRGRLVEAGPRLTNLVTAYQTAQDATSTYGLALERAQELAVRALAQGEQAVTERDAAERRRAEAESDDAGYAAKRRAAQLRLVEAAALKISPAALADPVYSASLDRWEHQIRAQFNYATTQQAQARRREREAAGAKHEAESRLEAARTLAEQASADQRTAAEVLVHVLNDAGDTSGVAPSWWQRLVHNAEGATGLKLGPKFELGSTKGFHGSKYKYQKGSWQRVEDDKNGKKNKPENAKFISVVSGSITGQSSVYKYGTGVRGKNGEAEASLRLLGAEGDLKGGIGGFEDGSYGVQASAAGAAYLAKVQASAKYGRGPLVADIKGTARAGVSGNATGELSLGRNRSRAALGADGLLGVEATAKAGVDVGGVKPTASASGWLGVGGSAKMDIGFDNGKFSVNTSIGAAIGIGGKVSGGMEIDIPRLANNVTDAQGKILHVGSSAAGSAIKKIGNLF